ncbi:MAG: hypothetical protein E7618_00495 [Ruminococcaceae bacterium]|nr:hypothetical protein [Oscillospiraceae bacterium]
MKPFLEFFKKHPFITILLLSLVGGVIGGITCLPLSNDHIDDCFLGTFLFGCLALTALLSLANFFFLFTRPERSRRDRALRILEPFGLLFGGFFAALLGEGYFGKEWYEATIQGENHTAMAREHLPTVAVLLGLAVVGYLLLRFSSLERLPPLVTVGSMAALMIGMGLVIVFLCQVIPANEPTSEIGLIWIYASNVLIVGVRALSDTVIRYGRGEGRKTRFPFLNRLLERCLLLPIVAVLAALPLLFLVVIVMMLFGQQPDSLIRVWTETADWNFSQMTPPPPIPYEGHYLCTVAATGHRRVVKPLRTGVRHGHTVVVNRQLQVANAFEELLAERLPRFHRIVRRTYDTVGLPFAKKVKSPYICDIIYVLMKPLEWLFLLVLYACDRQPENRIALQYPHKPFKK